MTPPVQPARTRRPRQSDAPASQAQSMRPHAAAAAGLLRALGNTHRLMILCNLADGEVTVGELIARLPLSQSATSQHLAVLREQGIVATRRDAQTIYYSLKPGPAAQVIDVLHGIYCGTGSSAAG